MELSEHNLNSRNWRNKIPKSITVILTNHCIDRLKERFGASEPNKTIEILNNEQSECLLTRTKKQEYVYVRGIGASMPITFGTCGYVAKTIQPTKCHVSKKNVGVDVNVRWCLGGDV